MQEMSHPSVAQSTTVKQSDCCNLGNSDCKNIMFLVRISMQMHNHRHLILEAVREYIVDQVKNCHFYRGLRADDIVTLIGL